MLCFLLPSAVSTTHAAQGHDHFDQCEFAGELHVHESKLDCDLGDLNVVKVHFYAFAKAYTLSSQATPQKSYSYTSETYSQFVERSQTRGPPVC